MPSDRLAIGQFRPRRDYKILGRIFDPIVHTVDVVIIEQIETGRGIEAHYLDTGFVIDLRCLRRSGTRSRRQSDGAQRRSYRAAKWQKFLVCGRTKKSPQTRCVCNIQTRNPLLHCSNMGMLVGFARKANHPESGLSRLSNGSVGHENSRSEQLGFRLKAFI